MDLFKCKFFLTFSFLYLWPEALIRLIIILSPSFFGRLLSKARASVWSTSWLLKTYMYNQSRNFESYFFKSRNTCKSANYTSSITCIWFREEFSPLSTFISRAEVNSLMKGELCCISCFRAWFSSIDVGFVESWTTKIQVARYLYMYNVGWYELWKG